MSQLIDIKTLGGSCCNNSWRQYTSFSSRVVLLLSRTPCHFTITTATGQRTKSLYYSLHDVCTTTIVSSSAYYDVCSFSPQEDSWFLFSKVCGRCPFAQTRYFCSYTLLIKSRTVFRASVLLSITDDVIKCSKLQSGTTSVASFTAQFWTFYGIICYQ